MALYHKWCVKTGFIFALQFFMLISDGLGSVMLFDRQNNLIIQNLFFMDICGE